MKLTSNVSDKVSIELHVVNILTDTIYSINKDQTYRALKRAILEIYEHDSVGTLTNEHVDLVHKLYSLLTTISLCNSELHEVLAKNVTTPPEKSEPIKSGWFGVEGRNGPPGS